MTDTNPARISQLDRLRQDNGRFGAKLQSDPELRLFSAPASPEDTTYAVYANGDPVVVGKKGGGMSEALHLARVYANGRNDKPALVIRASADDGTGYAEVALPFADQGRIVGWYGGDAVTAEEMDSKGISLSEFDSVQVEPYIDLGPYNEGDLPNVEQWARDADFGVSNVYARRDDETGGRHIDVSVNENFLWNASSQFPDDEADGDDSTAEERYEAWLDEHKDVVDEVYLEWFNAEVIVSDSWESADVSIRKTVPYERFTESLVIEDVYPAMAKYKNETDPGTFGSAYVMAEVWKRVEAREASAAADAEKQLAFEQHILEHGR